MPSDSLQPNGDNDCSILSLYCVQGSILYATYSIRYLISCTLCDTLYTIYYILYTNSERDRMGSALMVSLQVSCFLTEGPFGYSG